MVESSSKKESGIGLIEVSIALLIFMVALLTLAQALTFAVALNRKNREILVANTLCRDKVEQLLSLDFDDVASNTSVDPMGTNPLKYATDGTGLSDGGSIAPDLPDDNPPGKFFRDYITSSGVRTTDLTAKGIFFVRQWKIETLGDVKTIRVTVVTPSSFGLTTTASMVAFKTRSQ